MTKPITAWLTPSGPNSWKVITVLDELEVPYEIHSFKFDDVKKRPFIDINSNGRDPGRPLLLEVPPLWILIPTLPSESQVPFCNTSRRFTIQTKVYLQLTEREASTEPVAPFPDERTGPILWSMWIVQRSSPRETTSAIDRYVKEMHRILGVLNAALGGRTWLVGDKCTFADLAFLPWNTRVNMALLTPEGEDPLAPYPNVQAWHNRMESRESWQKAMQTRDKLMNEQGLMPSGMPKGVTDLNGYREYVEKASGGQ